jgi:ribosomal-protein-alanine N-acetyltransferase
MSEILTTQRLVLHPLSVGDLAALVPLLSDYDVAKNLTHVPHPYSMAHAREWMAIAQTKRQMREGFHWSVYRDKTFIGVVSVGSEQGLFNLGYWYGKPHWGQGYATEAARRAVAFAFAELDVFALASGYYSDNPASGRVLEKLGFEPAGIELLHCLSRGQTVVCNRVLLTREEFVQKKAA